MPTRRLTALLLFCSVGGLGPLRPVRSQKAQRDAPATAATRDLVRRFEDGRKWAVVVGVNEYLDPAIADLDFCVADAKLVADTLANHCGYESKRILTLTDDQPRTGLRPLKMSMQTKIDGWLKMADEKDTVLVFFAGHGFLDGRGRGYLAPQDCRTSNLEGTAFPTRDLRNMLNQCRAAQKILILDCCHSGSQRGAEAVGPSSQELGKAFEDAGGLIMLASCGRNETSAEWAEKGHGLFSYFLAEGLKGAADRDHNRLVDSYELHHYVADEVSLKAVRELNAQQRPRLLIGEDVSGVFALATVVTMKSTYPKEITNSLGMKLLLIEPGELMMGSNESAEALAKALGPTASGFARYYNIQHPQHRVTIPAAFYLGACEVTVAQFRRFVQDTGYVTDAEKRGPKGNWRQTHPEQTDNHPVFLISRNDAEAFCGWLSRKESRTYRLPTEAEWEYACRAGSTTRWCFGDSPDEADQYAWNGYNTLKRTQPVGLKKANAWGFQDMHGNVWEWCADDNGDGEDRPTPARNRTAPAPRKWPIARGGSVGDPQAGTISASRKYMIGDKAPPWTGFRVAVSPQ